MHHDMIGRWVVAKDAEAYDERNIKYLVATIAILAHFIKPMLLAPNISSDLHSIRSHKSD
jgi:hypothetical protein